MKNLSTTVTYDFALHKTVGEVIVGQQVWHDKDPHAQRPPPQTRAQTL